MMISKRIRELVHAKYGGRCAYCGESIKLEDMQVDHFRPLARGVPDGYLLEERGTDDIDNLMPSCRMCNFYKERTSIEGFRSKLKNLLDYKRTFATRMALKYGILVEEGWDGKFYFERKED
jgi:5-methylcytosine-specific restriction endonuclease McrA